METAISIKPDNLKVIEGIGPKIEQLLNEAGINTWAELSKTEVSTLTKILTNAGSRYKMHDPSTWSKQSAMAAKGEWDQLKEYQDRLDGGKE